MLRQQELETKVRLQSCSYSECLALALTSLTCAGKQPTGGEWLSWIHMDNQPNPTTLHQNLHQAQGKEGKNVWFWWTNAILDIEQKIYIQAEFKS